MKLDVAIAELHAAESKLRERLLELGERHKADHDVYHLTRTLATAARERISALEPHAERYGADVDRAAPTAAATATAPDTEPLLLLRDMRELHLLCAEASIDWTILGQGAQAARDAELLATVSACHPEALRALRWTTTKLKESAPQVLTS